MKYTDEITVQHHLYHDANEAVEDVQEMLTGYGFVKETKRAETETHITFEVESDDTWNLAITVCEIQDELLSRGIYMRPDRARVKRSRRKA